MKSQIVRIFVLLIICTLVAVFFFHAGVQFSEFSNGKNRKASRDYPFGLGNDGPAIIRAALPAMSLLNGDGQHPRGRRDFIMAAQQEMTVDNSAIAVDGIIYPDSSTKIVFNTREKFSVKARMGGGFFYTPPHDGTLLLKNETTRLAQHSSTRLVKLMRNHMVSTSLVFSFSPDVERRVKTMFPDPMKENVFFANSPALYWDRDFNNSEGRLVVVMRIWLDRERYEDKNNWPHNAFLDNYFYTRTYNRNFEPIDPGQLMGIPTHGGSSIGDGPIEPRLFPAFNRSNLFVSFNTGMTGLNQKAKDYTLFWDYRNNKISYPVIHGFSPMLDNPSESFPRDKHWSAFNLRQSPDAPPLIHFVHNLDPLRILRCDAIFSCRIIYAAGTAKENLFDDLKHHLRGGTPFVHYASRYYIGFGHVTLFKKRTKDTRRYYTTNAIVLRADPTKSPPYQLVFVSDPLRIARDLLNSVPIVRYMYIEDPFIFPVGLVLENRDTAILGVHINDHTAVLLRIRGLEAIMKDVIAIDEEDRDWLTASSFAGSSTKTGLPRPGSLIGPNQFTRILAEKESAAQFEYSDGD